MHHEESGANGLLSMLHVDNEGIIDGFWTGEAKCIGQKAKDADLWIMKWEDLHRFDSPRRQTSWRPAQSSREAVRCTQ